MENNLKVSTAGKRIGFLVGIAVFLFVACFIGWYIYRDLKSANQGPTLIEKSLPSEPVPAAINVEEIKKQMPDLNREIIIKENLSEKAKNRAIAEIKIITGTLKADYDRREDWLNLGLWRKSIGDYEGARDAWQFVTVIRPEDPVAFHNLGDLYSQYLIDFPKAEKYYLTAIEKDTTHQSFFFVKLYEFYRYFSKKPDLAEKILVDALKTNPGNEYLQGLLDDFRREK